MRSLVCVLAGIVALCGCGDDGGSTSSTTSDTSSGGGGSGGTGGNGGAATTTSEGGNGGAATTSEGGGATTTSATTTSGATTSSTTTTTGGTQGEGQPCGQSADGAMCKSGLVCCYPCGIEGCDFTCTVPCEAGSPGCADDGCLLLP